MKFTSYFIALFVACMLAIPAQIASAADQSATLRTISVQGNGIISVNPDQANVSIGIQTSAPSADKAEAENSKIATDIRNALLALGIAKTDIQTARYNFSPVYNTDRVSATSEKLPKIIAYSVDNTITVTLSDPKKIGTVIDQSLQAGANAIHSVQFGLKNTQNDQSRALEEAVKDAKAKAELIAKAMNKQVINVVTVKENGSYAETMNYPRYSFLKSAGASDSVPIEAGNVTIRATVDITFEIE